MGKWFSKKSVAPVVKKGWNVRIREGDDKLWGWWLYEGDPRDVYAANLGTAQNRDDALLLATAAKRAILASRARVAATETIEL